MKLQLAEDLHVIGKVINKGDKQFSFLSYLLHGDVNILIDTVPVRSQDMLLEEIKSIIGADHLDAIIANHSEEDHSGALSAVLEAYEGTPVYGTEACGRRLSSVVPATSFHAVHTGETLSLGSYSFLFTETPGLHWDDNMVTFLNGKNILFSNDLFGQFAAADPIVDTSYPADALMGGAERYYTKVFSAASAAEKSVLKDIARLPLTMIAPGHGLVLQSHWMEILAFYYQQCLGQNKQL